MRGIRLTNVRWCAHVLVVMLTGQATFFRCCLEHLQAVAELPHEAGGYGRIAHAQAAAERLLLRSRGAKDERPRVGALVVQAGKERLWPAGNRDRLELGQRTRVPGQTGLDGFQLVGAFA